MVKFQVPATSANLGIGFDSMGIALSIFNTFSVEFSDEWKLSGFDPEFSDENNLFCMGYKKACEAVGVEAKPLQVVCEAKIPVSRGLGSSSSLIVGGIIACRKLHNIELSDELALKIATKIEGHPDNVAPAIYGGLCVISGDKVARFSVNPGFSFSVFIPDFPVSTKEARSVLPKMYERSDAVRNIASAVIGVDALIHYKPENIHVLMNDRIHEPYRKALIPRFEEIKKTALENGALAFLISGSGSAMLAISDTTDDFCEIMKEKFPDLDIQKVTVV